MIQFQYSILKYVLLGSLFGDNSARQRLLLVLSDAAPYMIKAMKDLKIFYPKIIHVTCIVHGLHRVCEQIRIIFPLANRWVSIIKKVLWILFINFYSSTHILIN